MLEKRILLTKKPRMMREETGCEYIWNIFRKNEILLEKTGDGAFSVPRGGLPPVTPEAAEHIHEFETAGGLPVRGFKVSESAGPPSGYVFMPLRASFDCLPRSVYEMAGKMEELVYWDSRNRYCGVCGAELMYETKISKRCAACGNEIWPQLQVAVMALVRRGREILLVQSKDFRSDYMGLVAGFVETGETLEQCVEREVMEETNLRISGVRYFRSQAWPYPCGLMAGFVADYAGGELVLQPSELNKGGWYSADNLPAVPGKASLARQLIDAWLSGEL